MGSQSRTRLSNFHYFIQPSELLIFSKPNHPYFTLKKLSDSVNLLFHTEVQVFELSSRRSKLVPWEAGKLSSPGTKPFANIEYQREGTHEVATLTVPWEMQTDKPKFSDRPRWHLKIIFYANIQFSRSVVSDSLWHHGLQHTRLPCPSPTPGAYSNSCPLSRWCHPTISSSVTPLSSCLQSYGNIIPT